MHEMMNPRIWKQRREEMIGALRGRSLLLRTRRGHQRVQLRLFRMALALVIVGILPLVGEFVHQRS